MNVRHLFTEIEKADPEVFERMDTRRTAMKQFTGVAGKLALAAVPLALGGLFKRAYGQSTDGVLGILNYALTLEYLEAKFYSMGNAAISAGSLTVPTDAAKAALQKIGADETAHVNFLKAAVTGAGGTPVNEPAFDFTAGGAFSDVFSNYALFLAVAQTFEDTGVRAYKGQAAEPPLMANNDVLTAALNIHSVEARHASHIRQMRKANGGLVPAGVNVKPWITLKQSGIDSPAVQSSYNGEELTTQAGVNIVNINGMSVSAEAASEAFDEPLSKQQVLDIVSPFFA
jgi:hypothetical protein